MKKLLEKIALVFVVAVIAVSLSACGKVSAGTDGQPGPQGEQGLQGPHGSAGQSAFEIWLESNQKHDYNSDGIYDESDFINWLKGETGGTGPQGASAFDLWIDEFFNGEEGYLTVRDFFSWLAGDVAIVNTKAELTDALAGTQKIIMLAKDIEQNGDLVIKRDVTINMNDKTIFGCIILKANVVLENGTIIASSADWYSVMLDKTTDAFDITIKNVVAKGYYCGFYTNGLGSGATITVNDSHFESMYEERNEAAMYLAGNHTYNFVNCKFNGGTGAHMKSGTYSFDNCDFLAYAPEHINPVYWNNGGTPTGSALYLELSQGYAQILDVIVKDCTFNSAQGYGIESVYSYPSGHDNTIGNVTFEGENIFIVAKDRANWNIEKVEAMAETLKNATTSDGSVSITEGGVAYVADTNSHGGDSADHPEKFTYSAGSLRVDVIGGKTINLDIDTELKDGDFIILTITLGNDTNGYAAAVNLALVCDGDELKIGFLAGWNYTYAGLQTVENFNNLTINFDAAYESVTFGTESSSVSYTGGAGEAKTIRSIWMNKASVEYMTLTHVAVV